MDTRADATIRVLTRDEFAPLTSAAARVYGAAMNRSARTVEQRAELINTHLSRPDFAAVVALSQDEELLGFGYGYAGRSGQWWHDVVAGAIGREAAATWLHNTFELAEFHVDPPAQGNGIGRQIIETLLGEVRSATVVLSTHDRESVARGLYRSLGFIDLRVDFRFPGSAEVYALMGLQLH